MTDAAEIETLAKLWAGHPSGNIEAGAVEHIGLYLASEVDPAQWHREAGRQAERVRAVLRWACSDETDVEREERVRYICRHAEFFAADEVEERRERDKQRKVIPISQAKKHGDQEPLAVERLSAVLHRVMAEAEHPTAAISTPFPTLNHLLLGGFRPGELVYLGARPGKGKSAFALEVMRHVGRQRRSVLFISREMSLESLGRRVVAQEGRLDAGTLRTGRSVDWQGVSEAMQRLYELPVYMTQRARTIQEIYAATQQVPELALVIIDYLQLLTPPREIRDRRIQVEYLSARLKALAIHANVPVLVLSSLARPESKAEDKPPTMASLRDSGALEHDADTVLLLHRQGAESHTQCLVVKNRDALLGKVDLLFRPESVGFDELMSSEEEARYGS